MRSRLTRATLGRLPAYLAYVRGLEKDGASHTSATAIARALDLGEVQVRKDLSDISGAGKPKTGYSVGDLIRTMESRLGDERKNRAVLIGAGKLGGALLDYDGFGAYGLEILAAFDCNAARIGQTETGKRIYPMEELEPFVREHGVSIGILTVPAEAAQSVCDRLIELGVRGVWSFAPVALRCPEGVWIRRENLALSLACLSGLLSGVGETVTLAGKEEMRR